MASVISGSTARVRCTAFRICQTAMRVLCDKRRAFCVICALRIPLLTLRGLLFASTGNLNCRRSTRLLKAVVWQLPDGWDSNHKLTSCGLIAETWSGFEKLV